MQDRHHSGRHCSRVNSCKIIFATLPVGWWQNSRTRPEVDCVNRIEISIIQIDTTQVGITQVCSNQSSDINQCGNLRLHHQVGTIQVGIIQVSTTQVGISSSTLKKLIFRLISQVGIILEYSGRHISGQSGWQFQTFSSLLPLECISVKQPSSSSIVELEEFSMVETSLRFQE